MRPALIAFTAIALVGGPAAAQGYYAYGRGGYMPPPGPPARGGEYTCQALGCTHWGQRPPPPMHRPPQPPPMHHPPQPRPHPCAYGCPQPWPQVNFSASAQASASARASSSARAGASVNGSVRMQPPPAWWGRPW